MDMSLSKRCSFHRKVKMLVAQPCPTLCNPMDYNLPGSSVPEFSKQEYWSGLPFPSPGDLPDPGIEPGSPAFQADALTSELPGKPKIICGHGYTTFQRFTGFYRISLSFPIFSFLIYLFSY